jgi:hypothetical protein
VNKKEETRPPINLLELIPVRAVEWKKSEELVVLLKPKFKHPFLVKNLLPRLKKPHYKIKLDEIGSYFWENCDGQKNVKDIAELHQRKFGERVEPLYDRISMFLQSLEKNGLILLERKN